MQRTILLVTGLLAFGTVAAGEPLVPHPDVSPLPGAARAHQLGAFGESVAREAYRVHGAGVFNPNLGRNGIDALVKVVGPDGAPEYRVVEIKTRSDAYPLKEVEQLRHEHVVDRLSKAAERHPDPATRRAAAEALERARAGRLVHELHTLSVTDNLHQVHRVDPRTGRVAAEPVTRQKLTEVLDTLARKAADPATRTAAGAHREALERLRPPARPPAEVSAPSKVRAEPAAVGRGAKVLKGAAKGVVVVGAVVEAYDRGTRAAEVEHQYQAGQVSDPERVTAHAKNVAGAAGGASGAAAGAWALGSAGTAVGVAGGPVGALVGGGLGTLAGGVLGYVGGEAAAEHVVEVSKEWIYRRVQGARRAGAWVGSAWRSLVD